MWRQGDVFIAPVAKLPKDAKRRAGGVLVEGEMTGHSHRVEDLRGAELFEFKSDLFIQVRAETVRVVHQEHGPVTLPRGTYRVWGQREYHPEAIRRVLD